MLSGAILRGPVQVSMVLAGFHVDLHGRSIASR